MLRSHFIPVRMATIRIQTTNDDGKNMGKKEPSNSAGGNVN
jgi:hypothetical protein